MEDLCRICRKHCPFNSIHISSSHEGIQVSEMLSRTLPIDISYDDPLTQLLPQYICTDCIEVISAAFNLQRVCIESDSYFRSMLTSEQVVIKNEILEDQVAVKEEEMDYSMDDSIFQAEEEVTYLVPVTKKRKLQQPTVFNPRQKLHGSQSHYECNFCLVQFKTRQHAVKHMKQEHDPAYLLFGCDYCAARFKSEAKKNLHESVRHAGEKKCAIVCKFCGVNGISADGMRNHLVDDHKMDAKDVIEGVKDEFSGREVKFNPRPFNKGTRYEDIFYQCNFCDVKLKPRQNLLRHMYNKHDPRELPFYCRFCDYRSKDEYLKNQHEQSHNPTEKTAYFCEICTATGTKEDGMDQHKIDDHGTESAPILSKIYIEFHPRSLSDGDDEDVWYLCSFCDKKIKPQENMLRHMRKHSAMAYPYGCEYCTDRFQQEFELTDHLIGVHGQDLHEKSTLFCDLCGASGDNKEGLQHHMKADHFATNTNSKCSFKCQFCKTKFSTQNRLDRHLLRKHKEPTKCDKCDEEFSDNKEMVHHTMMVHSKLYRQVDPEEIKVNFKCCKCEKNHNSLDELTEHIMWHKSTYPAEKIKCELCSKKMKDFNEFVRHAKYHALPLTHECLTCKKQMPFDDKLLNHVKNHKRYDSYKVECMKCNQKFRSQKELENHDKVKHNKETLFICPICARSLCSASGLDQHIKYVHNKDQEKKFACKFCPMKFVLKTKLTRHEAVHSTERPHVCEICGKSFKHNEGLSLHMKRHNGTLLRKHACTQCSHKFATKHRLNQHMMTHTGLKPHECKFCDRAYASKGDLTKHMQKLHVGDAIYQCDQCTRAFRLIVELREHQMEHGENQ